MGPPRIAVTGMWANQVHGLRFDGSAVAAAVLKSVVRAGGEPLTLFAESALSPEERLRGFDALLVPGGADVAPDRYGQQRDVHTATPDFAVQDVFEAEMLAAAVRLGLPVLAICRGFQLLNVECGGTLVQDLAPGSVHRDGVHEVQLAPGSLLKGAIDAQSLRVSSYHHQAIDRLGDGLHAAAVASDGVVEAIEYEDPSVELLAIQWHPEDTAHEDAQQHAIFAWLIERARQQKS